MIIICVSAITHNSVEFDNYFKLSSVSALSQCRSQFMIPHHCHNRFNNKHNCVDSFPETVFTVSHNSYYVYDKQTPHSYILIPTHTCVQAQCMCTVCSPKRLNWILCAVYQTK